MAILITGGCGFIGFNLAQRLAEKDVDIVLFDISQDVNLEGLRGNIRHVNGDISNWPEVLGVVKESSVECIFHLAGLLSAPSEANPWRSYRVNVEGTFYILEAARLFNVKKVIFSSSMGVYGVTGEETITDASPQDPTIMYGVTKVFDELLGKYYQRRFGIDFRGIRFPQLIGPGVKSGGFGQYNPGMIEAAASGTPYEVWVPEDTILPLLYIKDAVRSLVELYEAEASFIKTRVYNLGQIMPSPTAKELSEIVKEYIPNARISFNPDPRAVEVLRSIPKKIDGSKASEEWGWKIEYGARETVRDFLKTIRDVRAKDTI